MNGRKKGKNGERKVKKALKIYARQNGCRVLNSIYLPLYSGCCEIDHIICGAFGAAVIETKNIDGRIYGFAADKYLKHEMGSKKHCLYNPLFQNRTHCDNVSYHLKKAGMRNIPVYSFVVFSGDSIIITNPELGIKLNVLPEKLSTLKNCGCNANQIYYELIKIRVKNPLKKFLHILKIKIKKQNKK